MSNNIKINNKTKGKNMRQEYLSWKLNALDEAAYFIIFQGFVESKILKEISGNALKLYVYLGMYSNNFEGVVWHSTLKIANYFEKSERTIRSWMKELEDLKLIKRMRLKYNGEVYTYLRPYNIKTSKKNVLTEGVLSVSKEKSLVFRFKYDDKEKAIYISSGQELEIYDYSTSRWIDGKIIISRSIDDYRFTYIFKSKRNELEERIELKQGITLKARIDGIN